MRVACLLLSMALAACGSSAPDDALFPLAGGHRWTYRVTTAFDESEPRQETLTFFGRGVETVAGEPAWRRHSDSGLDYWLRSDATGIYRVAAKGPLDRQPRKDEPRRYVLQKPYAVGTQWQASTTAYVLERRNEVPRELSRVHPSLPMTYRIDALNQRVETQAGRFDGCLRVQGKAEIRLYVDAAFAYREIPLTTTEWYCPYVGLVKLERKEPSPSKFIVGGRLEMELTAWR